MHKRNLLLWALYDCGSAMIVVTFALYFSQWLVLEGGLSALWYNATFAIATILLIPTAPFFAHYADARGKKKLLLGGAALGTLLGCIGSVGGAYLGLPIVVVTGFFIVAQYFYQGSFIFLNALITDVASPSERARASGLGFAAHFTGEVLGIVIALPFAYSRLMALVPALIAFTLCALPLILFFQEEKRLPQSARFGLGLEFQKARSFFLLSASVPLIVAFFFFNDALITLSNNYALYLEKVFGISDVLKSLLLLLVVLMAALGAATIAWIGDRFDPLRLLKIMLGVAACAFPLLAGAPNYYVFAMLTVPAGFLVGAALAVSRSYMSTLLDEGENTYGFAFYTLFERFATFVGPITWGSIVVLNGNGALGYRLATVAMGCIVLIGLSILLLFKRQKMPGAPASLRA